MTKQKIIRQLRALVGSGPSRAMAGLFLFVAVAGSGRVGAVKANLASCNQTLGQLTAAVIDVGTKAPAVSEFIRAVAERRKSLIQKKLEAESEISRLEDLIAEDQLTLVGIDWLLNRTIKYPSVTAKPWVKRIKKLDRHVRELERDLAAIESTYESELFARMATHGGGKGYYTKRLADYLVDYGYRIEDVEWVLESLRAMNEAIAVIEAPLPADANALARGQHAIEVRWSQRRLNKIVGSRMKTIVAVQKVTNDLTPFSGLDRLPPFLGTSADAEKWIGAFEQARATLKSQHDRISAKYDSMKSLAEKAALR